MKLHFVDLETSHLSHLKGEITEIAIVTTDLRNNTISVYEKKVKLANRVSANPKALEIGNYDDELWEKEGVWFADIAEEISLILKDGIFVAHNVYFDYSFVITQLSKYGFDKITYKRFDTKDLIFEHLYPHLGSTSMASIRNFFNWSFKNSHTALKDAEDCRAIFFALNKCSYLKRLYYIYRFKIRSYLLSSSIPTLQVLGLYF